jgi:hypothetical protein
MEQNLQQSLGQMQTLVEGIHRFVMNIYFYNQIHEWLASKLKEKNEKYDRRKMKKVRYEENKRSIRTLPNTLIWGSNCLLISGSNSLYGTMCWKQHKNNQIETSLLYKQNIKLCW